MDLVTSHFTTWPFSVVPDQTSKLIWAGRSELREKLHRLLDSFGYRPQSSLDLVWAAFGSGKTHLLRYLEQIASERKNIVPWYCVVPKRARSFGEVYRALMTAFPFQAVDADVVKAVSGNHRYEIASALKALTMGSPEQQDMATDWLRGMKVDMRTARRLLALPYKLETEAQMQSVLVQVAGALAQSGKRVLLLLDEYQRVQTHRSSTRDILNGAILDAFNAMPRGLSIVFSCSAAQQATAMRVLSPELMSRMRGRDILCLPAMSETEALSFVLDLLRAFRPLEYNGSEHAPFPDGALHTTVKKMAATGRLSLIPRHVIQVFDRSLASAVESNATDVSSDQLSAAVTAVADSPEGEEDL